MWGKFLTIEIVLIASSKKKALFLFSIIKLYVSNCIRLAIYDLFYYFLDQFHWSVLHYCSDIELIGK